MEENIPSPEEPTELHAIVHGRVQGVWFRATTCEHAKALDLTGTVKNLPDGTVEIYAQGPKDRLNQLLTNLKENPGMGSVDSLDVTFRMPQEPFTHFHVAY